MTLYHQQYHTIPGTDTVVPIMSLGDGLQKMNLKGKNRRGDPVAEAAKKGKVPTLRDVKKSVKVCVVIKQRQRPADPVVPDSPQNIDKRYNADGRAPK
jgi:hypothetical protein